MKLADVCDAVVDCEHKTAPTDPTGKFFAVGTPAMRQNVIDYSQARRIGYETFRAWTRRLQPQHGDLLLAREAPVGPVVSIPREENVAPGQRTVLLRPNAAMCESRFLFYYLAMPSTQGRLNDLAAGSTVAHLNVADVRDFEVELPDLATQTAIADVLGALDDKIAANERIIRVSEDLLRTRFLRECDQAERTCRVADILDFNPPRPRPLDDEPIYVEMKDLGTHTSVITSWSRRAPLGGVRFQRGDTVMGRITPCLENGKVGYVDFLREGEIGIGSTEFIAMATRDGLPKPLSFLVAEHPGFRQEAVQLMVGTSGRQRVSARDLGEIELQLPDDGTLRELGRAAEAVFLSLIHI